MPKNKRKSRNGPKIEADAFEREVTTDLDEETPDKPKGLPLHARILIGLAVGVIAGVTVNYVLGGEDPRVAWIIDHITAPIGQLFLRLLLMIVVPLVFSSLVVGVAGIGDIRKLGRVGIKSFGYCLILSAIRSASGTPRRRIPTSSRSATPTFRSTICDANRESARAMPLASMICALSLKSIETPIGRRVAVNIARVL